MHEIKSQTAPTMFQGKFRKQAHKYSINFSTSNYSIPPFTLSKGKYIISIRGPALWKNISTNSKKMQVSVTVFKSYMKKKPSEIEIEITYF